MQLEDNTSENSKSTAGYWTGELVYSTDKTNWRDKPLRAPAHRNKPLNLRVESLLDLVVS